MKIILMVAVAGLIAGGIWLSHNKTVEPSVEIYAVYHKPWRVYSSDIIVPIHAGRALKNPQADVLRHQMIGDDTGDNISLKNQMYSELTALYWMWKNSKADIVGLMHYRRFLDLSDGKNQNCGDNLLCKYGLTYDNVLKLMKDNDIVAFTYTKPVLQYLYYAEWHYIENLNLALDYLYNNYPKEYSAAGPVLISKQLHGNNIFIMKKEILDRYAAWLFDVLFHIEDQLIYDKDQSRFSAIMFTHDPIYQKRAAAFVGERLFAIWLEAHKDEYKIIDKPLGGVDNDI